MGYKEQFMDYKLLDYEEVKRLEEQRLAKIKEDSPEKYNREIEKIAKRKELIRKQNQLKYKTEITQKEKVLLVKTLQDGENQFLEYQNNTCIINKIALDIQLTHYHEAIKWLMHVNLNTFLGVDVKRGENFSCGIIPGNIASINYDDGGCWRYFTRNKENTEGYVLGIIDLTEIIYNLNYHQALDKLCDMTLIHVKEAKWLKSQKTRYTENIERIHNAKKEIGMKYPTLYKYIKKHLYLLEELNQHGLATITNEEKSVDGMDIFFLSSRHLEKKLQAKGINKDFSNINKLLNMFTTIGMVIKIPLNQIPEQLQNEAKKFLKIKSSEVVKNYAEEKKNCHPISFYQIPVLSAEVLGEANKRVIRLKQEGIKATGVSISSKKLKNALGESLYSSLFQKEKIMIVKGIEKAKRIQREKAKEDKAQTAI